LVSIDNINDERYFENGLLKKSDFTVVRWIRYILDLYLYLHLDLDLDFG
jgi:hypothetical protein